MVTDLRDIIISWQTLRLVSNQKWYISCDYSQQYMFNIFLIILQDYSPWDVVMEILWGLFILIDFYMCCFIF